MTFCSLKQSRSPGLPSSGSTLFGINLSGWFCLSALFLGVCLSLLPACGYTQKDIYPTDIHTVAVPIFKNRTFYRKMEFDLTESLIKTIESQTPYKVVAREQADTLLQGTIISVEQRQLIVEHGTGLPSEMEVRVAVDFEWKNLRTGKIIRQRQGFASVGRYIPQLGESDATAQHVAVERIAKDIISSMQADW